MSSATTVFEKRSYLIEIDDLIMKRTNPSKKIQNNNTPRILLVKNYLEQELETQGYGGHVKYDSTNKALIQFRTKEGTIAILKEGTIQIFEMPIKKFQEGISMPLESESVQIDSIQTQKATCCKSCHSWKQQANITRCVCGGYLVPRKRFSVDSVESWDEEFLEIEFARKDIREAKKTERVLSCRTKQYIPTGITTKLAGVSCIIPEKTPRAESLLIPKGDDVKVVPVRSVQSCSLIFAAAIASDEQIISDGQKMEILMQCQKEDSENDRQFAAEARRFLSESAPTHAKTMIDSWNNASEQPRYRQGRKGSSSKKQAKSLAKKSQKQAEETGRKGRKGSGQSRKTPMPVPAKHRKDVVGLGTQ